MDEFNLMADAYIHILIFTYIWEMFFLEYGEPPPKVPELKGLDYISVNIASCIYL